MARSWLKTRNHALILVALFVVPIARFYGQDKPQVAPSAKSDLFNQGENGETVRVQAREIPGTNFQIAGVDLAASDDLFNQAMEVLGKTDDQASDDDIDSRDEVCYRSAAPHDTTHLIFGQSDIERYFLLSSDGSAWLWKPPCRASARITRNLATSSGLHLGQTQEQVIAILGLPTSRDLDLKSGMDDMRYNLEAEKKMSAQELEPYLKDELKYNPKIDQRAWIKNNGSYTLWVSVDARFSNGHLISLKIVWLET